MAGIDPLTGQWSTNPGAASSVLQGYQPGGALPAGFFDMLRSQYGQPRDGAEYYDPITGYGFVPKYKESDGRFTFDGGTMYYGKDARAAKDNVGLNGQPGYVYDASGNPTGQPFQFQGMHANKGLNNPLIGAAIPLLAAGGAYLGGLGAAGGTGAAGAAGAAGAGAAGAAGTAGAIDLGGGLMMTADGAIVGATGAFAPATAAEMSAMGLGAEGIAGAGGAATAGSSFGEGVNLPAHELTHSAGEIGGLDGAGASTLLNGVSNGGTFDWTKLIGPGLSAVGGIAGANAAKSAANAQLQAAREAQALNEPFRQAGMKSMNRLLDLLGISGNTGAEGYGSAAKTFGASDFNADPGYQFRLDQGQKALERARSSAGLLGSGKYLKDAMNYNQGQASQEYGNAFNRFQTNRASVLNPLQSLMGAGQTAANTVGEYATQAGNAQAAGKVGQANALTNALTQGYGMYQNQQQQDQNNALFRTILGRQGGF